MSEILRNFWVLEGLDGAGTTTQLKNLEAYMMDKGLPVFRTAEPTIYETGKFIRRVLSGEVKVPQSTVAYLFAADRDNHLNNPEYGIKAHLAKGETVISDRYFFSSFAYQSIGFDPDAVMMLNSRFPYPELVLYVDTPVEDCISRIDSRGTDKEIYEKLDYQRLVHENYESFFKRLPEGCRLIRVDGTLTREEIFKFLIKEIGV
ncbi:MAG: dTMP kinase [Spirochaetales bacterium]|jgi:dTMP kinase|nr:dTMP kinase [Spirochaetales bacterium]MBQ3697548.1 dTMP kinase [Spirochaetales bacterium]MBQ3728026.1 dTMP kinase [Spirochaetales bacterium]MBQ3830488.1 dTMP kinase [Spirochaetales bacterium]MBQ4500225.1 dTMP kinase [Spirochaetales bacterium]